MDEKTETVNFYLQGRLCRVCCTEMEKSAKTATHMFRNCDIYFFVFDTEMTQINLLFVYFLFKLNKKRR